MTLCEYVEDIKRSDGGAAHMSSPQEDPNSESKRGHISDEEIAVTLQRRLLYLFDRGEFLQKQGSGLRSCTLHT